MIPSNNTRTTDARFTVALIQPPIRDYYDTDIRLQPIGLCYLKAAVEKWIPEVSVKVFDFHQGHGRRTVRVPPALKYLEAYYHLDDRSPFRGFDRFYHFGASFEQIATEIRNYSPSLVGISSLFSPYFREVLETADAIRRVTDVPIVVGGSHASALPERMLSHRSVDFVVRGEGELPLVELVGQMRGKRAWAEVPNLGYRDQRGELVFNALSDNYAIDELPIPDLSDLDPERYQLDRARLSFIVTSRSCPHKCTFCSVHTTFGRTYRRRSIDRVLEEIQQRYDEGYRVLDFEDDNLTLYVDEMKALCRSLIAAFPEKDMRFTAMNGISYLSLDEELLNLMRQAGFTHLNLALVSSDKTVRETTKRPHTISKYLDIVHAAHRLGFRLTSYQILGLPTETLSSMVQTLVFASRLPVLLGASMFYLTPNSPIAESFPEPTDEDVFRSRLTAMANETPHVSRDELFTLFITTRIINFLKGMRLAEMPAEIRSLSSLIEAAPSLPPRAQLGISILSRLLEEGTLYAVSPSHWIPRTSFNTPLFQSIWRSLNTITTLDGHTIRLDLPSHIHEARVESDKGRRQSPREGSSMEPSAAAAIE